MGPNLTRLIVISICCALCAPVATPTAAFANVSSPPPLDRPEVRLRVANLRTTQHACYWEFDWVVDNYGGVGATIVGRRNSIVGQSAVEVYPEWTSTTEMNLEVAPWARVSFADHARLEAPVEGCAFQAEIVLDLVDDRGLHFSLHYEVEGRSD